MQLHYLKLYQLCTNNTLSCGSKLKIIKQCATYFIRYSIYYLPAHDSSGKWFMIFRLLCGCREASTYLLRGLINFFHSSTFSKNTLCTQRTIGMYNVFFLMEFWLNCDFSEHENLDLPKISNYYFVKKR